MASRNDLSFSLAKAEAKLEAQERLFEDKDKQIENLTKQVAVLQEALVAKESPDFYRYHKAIEAEAELSEGDRALRDRAKEQAHITEQYVQELDKELTPEDLDNMLSMTLAANPPSTVAPEGYEDEV